MVSTVADFVVSMGSGGQIGGQGTVQEVLGIEPQLAAQFQYDDEALELDDNEEKLSEEEKVQHGKLVIHARPSFCVSSHNGLCSSRSVDEK